MGRAQLQSRRKKRTGRIDPHGRAFLCNYTTAAGIRNFPRRRSVIQVDNRHGDVIDFDATVLSDLPGPLCQQVGSLVRVHHATYECGCLGWSYDLPQSIRSQNTPMNKKDTASSFFVHDTYKCILRMTSTSKTSLGSNATHTLSHNRHHTLTNNNSC